jgi:hypothetical protein
VVTTIRSFLYVDSPAAVGEASEGRHVEALQGLSAWQPTTEAETANVDLLAFIKGQRIASHWPRRRRGRLSTPISDFTSQTANVTHCRGAPAAGSTPPVLFGESLGKFGCPGVAPIGKSRGVDRKVLRRHVLTLPIKGLMPGMFVDNDCDNHAFGRDATFDQVLWPRCLDDAALATTALRISVPLLESAQASLGWTIMISSRAGFPDNRPARSIPSQI